MSLERFVSVIMPVRNEEAFIARSLGAVLTQDYPAEQIEVLVADGESNDRTLEIIASLPGTERVRVLPNPRRIQAAGLNELLKAARGDVIVRVDGHTIIAPDYVRQCVTVLEETGAENVGGLIEPVGETLMGKAIAGAARVPFAVPGAFHVSSKGQFTDTVYLGAWPRQVLARVCGFNEHVHPNEDYELNYRIRQVGGKIYLSPAIRSQYFGRQTLHALARQYFTYGKAKVKTLSIHRASLRPRQVMAPLFLALLLIGGVFALISPLLEKLWLLLLVLYLGVNCAFSILVARRVGWRLFWWIPLVFLIIHLAWGAGFWVGVLGVKGKKFHKHASAPQFSVVDDI